MTGAWDGRPANPEVSGWHWVWHAGRAEVFEWKPRVELWLRPGDEIEWSMPDARKCLSYLGPCAPPGVEFKRGWEAARGRAMELTRAYLVGRPPAADAFVAAIRAMEPPA
jgi:hypothetical protein